MLDLIIIGGSSAVLSASIYASRRNLDFVLISKDLGGEVAMSGVVGNWPGIENINGFMLAQNFIKHAKSYNPKFEENSEVTKIEKQADNSFIIKTRDGNGVEKDSQTKAVIIASGIHPRMLGVPGEKELRGKGVTYCTTCDGPLFKNKVTATVGAGNSGIESAIMMSGIAKKVYIISRYENNAENNFGFPRGENILIDKLKSAPNVEIIYNAETKEILGDSVVKGLKYFDTKENIEKEITVDGVMVHVGMVPNSEFGIELNKNKMGEIEVDNRMATSVPGIFAAGDVTNSPYKQIAIASGQGVTAALSAIDYINKL